MCDKIIEYFIEKLVSKDRAWKEWYSGRIWAKVGLREIMININHPIEGQIYDILHKLVDNGIILIRMSGRAGLCCLCHRLLIDDEAVIDWAQFKWLNTYFEEFVNPKMFRHLLLEDNVVLLRSRYNLRWLVELTLYNPIPKKRMKQQDEWMTFKQILITHKVYDPRILLVIARF